MNLYSISLRKSTQNVHKNISCSCHNVCKLVKKIKTKCYLSCNLPNEIIFNPLKKVDASCRTFFVIVFDMHSNYTQIIVYELHVYDDELDRYWYINSTD